MINTHALPPAVHWGSAAKEALPAALKKLHLALHEAQHKVMKMMAMTLLKDVMF